MNEDNELTLAMLMEWTGLDREKVIHNALWYYRDRLSTEHNIKDSVVEGLRKKTKQVWFEPHLPSVPYEVQ